MTQAPLPPEGHYPPQQPPAQPAPGFGPPPGQYQAQQPAPGFGQYPPPGQYPVQPPFGGPPNPALDIQQNKVYAVLAYFGLLVLIPIFAAKQSPFARYHANQGLVLLIAGAIYAVIWGIISGIVAAATVNSVSFWLGGGVPVGYMLVNLVLGLVWLAFTAVAIIGIVHAAQGQFKPLPVIGGIKILK
ncbi:MAG: hypothetical protein LBG60_08385 [Bifidobacteriaceae bacterium]|jgi:uncharacterized membrane protein|nr:hypothetical protein [Bifidobacteriaceae bacterium]